MNTDEVNDESNKFSSQSGKVAKQRDGIANRWHCGDTWYEFAIILNTVFRLASRTFSSKPFFIKMLLFPINWEQTSPWYDLQVLPFWFIEVNDFL